MAIHSLKIVIKLFIFRYLLFDFLTVLACASLSEQPWVIHKFFNLILKLVEPLFLRKQGPGPHGWRRANATQKNNKNRLIHKKISLTTTTY